MRIKIFPISFQRSLIAISGTPVDKAKAAVQKCREAGVKAVLLTSLTGAEARSQAVELGVFTSESKTINDIATRLNVSVEKVCCFGDMFWYEAFNAVIIRVTTAISCYILLYLCELGQFSGA